MPDTFLSEVYATTYANNVYTLAQQQGSLLYPHVNHIPMTGEKLAINRVGATSMQQVTEGNNRDTPLITPAFSRRMLYAYPYDWGSLLDWTIDQGMNPIIDPTGPITQAGAMAAGRTLDQIIVNRGLTGSAYSGKEGLTEVAFPAAQKVAITYGGSVNTGLTLAKLRKARSILGLSKIPIKAMGQEMVMVITQRQLDDLLGITEVTNSDYNAVKALVNGEVDTFMGFKFVIIDEDLLPVTTITSGSTQSRTCIAFLKSTICMAEPQPVSTVINTRPDKCNAWQVYAKMKAGCTRYQDEGVVQVSCLENIA